MSNPTSLRHTTVFRLAAVFAALFAVAVTGIFIAVFLATRVQLRAQIDAGLSGEADALALVYQARGLAGLEKAVGSRVEAAAKLGTQGGVEDSGQRFYLLVSPRGRLLRGNLGEVPPAVRNKETVTEFHLPPDAKVIDRAGDPVHLVRAHIVKLRHGYHLLVGQAMNETQELERNLLLSLLAGLGSTLLIAAVGGLWMGRSVLRRIDSISGTAGEIMAGDLSRRVPLGPRDDEFAALSRRLNAMLDRIESLMTGMREVSDNVAHDLRTPLTRLRGRLEVTLLEARDPAQYREAMERAITDADGLLRTFTALLTMAQLQSGARRVSDAGVDLAEVCRDVGELYEALAEHTRVRLSQDLGGALIVHGDRELIAQAVSNVLDNAVKYTPPGGTVSLAVFRDPGRAIVAVRDTGPGIPEEHRERVFERFSRLDAARTCPGNGLGLTMVKAVMAAHGGDVVLAAAEPGLDVRLCFPVPSPAGAARPDQA